jgi:uncharacterized RDD family membrane protein YckC
MSVASSLAGGVPATPLRRTGAMVYDFMLLLAVEMVVTALFLPWLHGRVMVASEVGTVAYAYRAVQAGVAVAFFGFFWTRNGRTLGMQVWGLRMRTLSGALPSWRDAVLRCLAATVPWLPALAMGIAADYFPPRNLLLQIATGLLALVVLNYLVAYWDGERRAWHDRWLKTRIERVK